MGIGILIVVLGSLIYRGRSRLKNIFFRYKDRYKDIFLKKGLEYDS